MAFDDILTTASEDQKQSLIQQALKKQEYNRNYQRKLRVAAKLATLESKIDENLDHVIGYIKRKYDDQYTNYVEPVAVANAAPAHYQSFANWVLLSADEYRDATQAFEFSMLGEDMTYKDFNDLFVQHYSKGDDGKMHKNY